MVMRIYCFICDVFEHGPRTSIVMRSKDPAAGKAVACACGDISEFFVRNLDI